MDYIGEMQRVTHLDNLVEHGALKGSVFKKKMMSSNRIKGMAAFTFAGMTYANMAMITLMMGPTMPMLSIVGASMYGASLLNEKNQVSKIDYISEGEFAGFIRVTIQKSPFVSYNVIMNPKHTMSLCAVGADDMGEEDAEGNILYAKEYMTEADGERHQSGMFTVPADANRDKVTMEWIFAQKSETSKTDALFNQTIIARHLRLTETGGLTGLRKFTVEQTGYANFGDEAEIAAQLKDNPDSADDCLREMQDQFGQERLEKMAPTEFYRLYKDYSLGRQ